MANTEDRGEQARIYDRSTTSTRRSASTAAPLGMLGLLAAQFLLGMAVNLYVQLPSAGSSMAEMMRSGPLVMVHMMLGIGLTAGALAAVAVALPYGRWAVGCSDRWNWPSPAVVSARARGPELRFAATVSELVDICTVSIPPVVGFDGRVETRRMSSAVVLWSTSLVRAYPPAAGQR